MIFSNVEIEIIQSHFHNCEDNVDLIDETKCKIFMFNLEQHLASKDVYEELNNAENQLFYVLLTNNNIENGYTYGLVKSFQDVLVDMQPYRSG